MTLDCEAHVTRCDEGLGGTRQTWRLAVVTVDDADRRDPEEGPWREAVFRDPANLWQWVTTFTSPRRRLVVVAHNAGYDLRISRALVHLPGLGWELDWARMDNRTVTMAWRKGERSLVVCDLYSWLPHPLAEVARMVGEEKWRMPAWEAPDAEWAAYCAQDVKITRLAFWRILRATRELDWGDWRPTGAAQSYAFFRHRHLGNEKLLVGCEPASVGPEREAAHTGRCEVWRWGEVAGPLVEWDWASCYGSVARETSLPTRPAFRVTGERAERMSRRELGHAWCGLCRVRTDVPVVPARAEGRIVWPVGEFTTWLWDCEVRLARAVGATVTVEVLRAWRRSPLLRGAMDELMRLADATRGHPDPVVRATAKQFIRSLVGRFGMRHSVWEPWGEADEPDFVLSEVLDATTGESTRLLQVGRQLRWETAVTDAASAQPAVMAYVMAAARVRLWRAMETAGFDHVVYVDTDSLLVDEEGDRRLQRAVDCGQLAGLRVKSRWERASVLAPRQLVLDGQLRAAGVPRRARRLADGTWEAEVWSSMAASLAEGAPDVVTTRRQRFRLHARDFRREHLPGGATAPRELHGPGHLSPADAPMP